MTIFDFDFGSWLIGVCCGIIVMGIICDHVNKGQTKQLEERINTEAKGYQRIIDSLEHEVEQMSKKLNELLMGK